jgi:hypothetical protein
MFRQALIVHVPRGACLQYSFRSQLVFQCRGLVSGLSRASEPRLFRSKDSTTRKCPTADQREALKTHVHPPPSPHSGTGLSETGRSGQGRAGVARRSEPLTARTVLQLLPGGKGGETVWLFLGSGARWLASDAFPCGFLPCPCSLPRYRDGSASAFNYTVPTGL